ncbi:MAG: LLM class flavin-dependent oxidoreductase [Aerococcus sp.]|nr:LLM class flavin-dependent oxidoreductase [Aerococcus sp.]
MQADYPEMPLEFGLYTLGDHMPNPMTHEQIPPQERLRQIIKLGQLAEQAGFDSFQVGESHQQYFVSQSHFSILAALAAMTKRIKIGSSVTTLSVLDPVRVYEDATTIDLLSNGRMELVAGRASRLGGFQLYGIDQEDYTDIFEEKLALLKQLLVHPEAVTWSGRYRSSLHQQTLYPKPLRKLPLYRGVGNTASSAIKAGQAGLGLYQAHLAGSTNMYKHRIDSYRKAGVEAGYTLEELPVQTGGLTMVKKNQDDAFRTAYRYIDHGFVLANGQHFNKRAFAQGRSVKSIVNVGDPALVIDKLLYQYEHLHQNRLSFEIDFGGLPWSDIQETFDLLAEEVLPAVKRQLKQ